MDWDLLEELLKNPLAIYSLATALVAATLFFAFQLFRFGPDIRRLNKIETIAQLAHFADVQKQMTIAFGEATATSNAMKEAANNALKDLESLKEFVTDLQIKMSEFNADKITQTRLEEDLELPRGVLWQRTPPPLPPEQLFQSMKNEWAIFIEAFRRRLNEAGIPPQMNRIGKMTYMLTDRRRKNPLPVATADLITALNSQYRRHITKGTVGQEDHDAFVRLVKTAVEELQLAPRQGELELAQSADEGRTEISVQRLN
jgi:hypothetical protein